MKKLVSPGNGGGAPLHLDDFVRLQDEGAKPFQELCKAINGGNPFIISGCVVTGPVSSNYAISEGYIYINGDILHYPGTSATTMPATIYEDTPVPTLRPFFDAVQRQILEERVLVLTTGAAPIGVERITFVPDTTARLLTCINKYQDDSIALKANKAHEAWKIFGKNGVAGLATGWSHANGLGTDDTPLQFMKNDLGQIFLTGSLFLSNTAGVNIATLPAGYRPSMDIFIPVHVYDPTAIGSASRKTLYLDIDTDGTINIVDLNSLAGRSGTVVSINTSYYADYTNSLGGLPS